MLINVKIMYQINKRLILNHETATSKKIIAPMDFTPFEAMTYYTFCCKPYFIETDLVLQVSEFSHPAFAHYPTIHRRNDKDVEQCR